MLYIFLRDGTKIAIVYFSLKEKNEDQKSQTSFESE